METIEGRIVELKRIGAGDEQCLACLNISVTPIGVCRMCIELTNGFSPIVRPIIKSKTTSNAPSK